MRRDTDNHSSYLQRIQANKGDRMHWRIKRNEWKRITNYHIQYLFIPVRKEICLIMNSRFFKIAAIGIFVIFFIKANRVIGGPACNSITGWRNLPYPNTNEMNGDYILGYDYWLAKTVFILSLIDIPIAYSGAITSCTGSGITFVYVHISTLLFMSKDRTRFSIWLITCAK